MAELPGDAGNDDTPFAGFPMFADLARAMSGQGPLNWDLARQFALLGATGGVSESNVDPSARLAYADLAQIAALHVNDITGTDLSFPEPRVVTPGRWATDTLTAYRPLFTDLAHSLGQQPDSDEGDTPEVPMAAMLAGLGQMMAPAMIGMAVGSMVGHLATRVFGLHDLPIPRDQLDVVVVDHTIEAFCSEWELPVQEFRLWVMSHELSGYRLFSIAGLRDQLASLVRAHVGGFRPDPNAMTDYLSEMDMPDPSGDPMAALQNTFSDPTILLGAVQSPEQDALRPRLDAAVAAVVGYVDWVVDAVAARTIGGEALRIAEAVRRRRSETTPDDVFIEKLLGIRVGDDQVKRGKDFVQGVVDRVGEAGLSRLLELPGALPTPNDIEAPGLWIARLDEA
ncbi:MAG: hypothetical protein CSA55_00750 [Ilumatobacter coccineus]|uniref:Hydrolase n=1 Tax=Ilumatobacter coccineus TaxID=467094 RepID=A0A2G6KFH9_9ACTN|nr:MAG: hypothetical protein CSA55_00750 [Ilumatobacter coccineus]